MRENISSKRSRKLNSRTRWNVLRCVIEILHDHVTQEHVLKIDYILTLLHYFIGGTAMISTLFLAAGC